MMLAVLSRRASMLSTTASRRSYLATSAYGASVMARKLSKDVAADTGKASLLTCVSRGKRSFCAFPVHFIPAGGGDGTVVDAKDGQSILDVAHENNIDIEGACGGECACSTCHIILTQEGYDSLPEPDEDEVDMLDLAAHVTDTSRLGCQVKLQKGRDAGLRIQLAPDAMSAL
eukprot:TRINITY_DN14146_c0_g1_i1.p1 TRINITY_DN14146_c0_g1~~TRINITY_DN14146_c0_g1_i1.p1  ORF type:complete len:173 (+),score=39.44 TRINITY_DN14146_c0_g1_i1:86-604(+)